MSLTRNAVTSKKRHQRWNKSLTTLVWLQHAHYFHSFPKKCLDLRTASNMSAFVLNNICWVICFHLLKNQSQLVTWDSFLFTGFSKFAIISLGPWCNRVIKETRASVLFCLRRFLIDFVRSVTLHHRIALIPFPKYFDTTKTNSEGCEDWNKAAKKGVVKKE